MKQGIYHVNENVRKDSSLKSIICALLVFLAFCIAISLLLVILKKITPAENPSTDKSGEDGNGNFAAHSGKEWEKTTLGYDKKDVTHIEKTTIPTNKFATSTRSYYKNKEVTHAETTTITTPTNKFATSTRRPVLPTTTLKSTGDNVSSTSRDETNDINAIYETDDESSSTRPEIKRGNPKTVTISILEEINTTPPVEERNEPAIIKVDTESSTSSPKSTTREKPKTVTISILEEIDTTPPVEERNEHATFKVDMESSTSSPKTTTSNVTDKILIFATTDSIDFGIDHAIFHDGSSKEEIENSKTTEVPEFTQEEVFENITKDNSSQVNNQINIADRTTRKSIEVLNTATPLFENIGEPPSSAKPYKDIGYVFEPSTEDTDAGSSTDVPHTTAVLTVNPKQKTTNVSPTTTQINVIVFPVTQSSLLTKPIVENTTDNWAATEAYGTSSQLNSTDSFESVTEDSLATQASADTYNRVPQLNEAETVQLRSSTESSIDAYSTAPQLNEAETIQLISSTEVNLPRNDINTEENVISTTVVSLIQFIPVNSSNDTEAYTTLVTNLQDEDTTIQLSTEASTTTISPVHKPVINTSVAVKPPIKKQPTICTSAACKRTVSDMLRMMDHNADPCENFYKFACGGQEEDSKFLKKDDNQALLDRLQVIDNTSDYYLQVFKNFYQNCVEYEKNFKFTERIQLMEDFPNRTLTELFVELILTQSMPLFDIGLDIKKGSNQYYLQWRSPEESISLKSTIEGWNLLEQIKDFCLNEQRELTIGSIVDLDLVYKSYRNCQKRRFESVATNFVNEMKLYFPNHGVYNDENLQNLTTLLALSQRYSAKMKPKKAYNQLNKVIADLNAAYNLVDWKVFLQNITFNSTFVESDEVEVNADNYFYKILDVLNSDYSESDVQNMLQLYAKLQLWENTVVPKQRENRELYCLDLSKQLMPDITSSIVYDRVNYDQTFHMNTWKINMLFRNLKARFNESIEKSSLDNAVKKVLQDKLLRTKLGGISTGDYSTLRGHYNRITILENKYQENVIQMLKNYKTIIYSLERRMVNPATLLRYFVDFFYRPFKSFYASDYIVFHPAIFIGIHMQLPEHIFLAKIGMHLGRELAQQFNLIGRNYLNASQTSSVNDFYSSLRIQSRDLLLFYANNTYNIKGKTVYFEVENDALINEIIPDNAAFRLVHDWIDFKIQKELPWVSGTYPVKKVFYIAAAQEHCRKTTVLDFMVDMYESKTLPPPLKIQNVISNSKEFSATFECPEGSAMVIDDGLISQFPYIHVSNSDYDVDMSYN